MKLRKVYLSIVYTTIQNFRVCKILFILKKLQLLDSIDIALIKSVSRHLWYNFFCLFVCLFFSTFYSSENPGNNASLFTQKYKTSFFFFNIDYGKCCKS